MAKPDDTEHETPSLKQLFRWLKSKSSRMPSLTRGVAILMLLLSAGIAATFSRAGLRPLTDIFEVLNFSANLVNLGLLLVLFLFTRTFHISWKSLPAGIVLGFGIASSAEIGATGFISGLGMNGILSSDMLRTLAFLVCTIVWIIYAFLPDTGQEFTGPGVRRSEIEAWNQDLHKILDR